LPSCANGAVQAPGLRLEWTRTYVLGFSHSLASLCAIHRSKWNNVNISISIRHADSLEAPDTVGDCRYRTACPSEAQSVRLFLTRSLTYMRSRRLQRGPLPDGIFPEPVPELVPVPAPRCCELSQSFCAAASAALSAVPALMCAQSFGRGIVELGRSRVVLSCFN
jgi:hypothetical protein